MLKLENLTFQNIGRFVEKQTIDFTGLSSLIQLDAKNTHTNGSSGSGKSTVFHAISWLIGLSDIPTSTLQSRLTKNHISVTGTFSTYNKKIVITRNKKLSITVDGVETVGSSKLSEELLDDIIGMPRNIFSALLYRKQGDPGFFLQMTPSKMNDFLVDVLGLFNVRNKTDLIDTKLKSLTQAKIQSQSSLEATKTGLEANKRALGAIGQEPTTNASNELLEGFRNLYDTSKVKFLNKKTAHNEETTLLEQKKPKIESVSFDRSTLDSIENECVSIAQKINLIKNKEKDRQNAINTKIANLKSESNDKISTLKLESNTVLSDLKANILEKTNIVRAAEKSSVGMSKILTQLETLRNGVCFTCKRDGWLSDSVKDQEQKLAQQLEDWKTIVEKAKIANVEYEELKNNYLLFNNTFNDKVSLIERELAIEIEELTKQLVSQLPEVLVDLENKLEDLAKQKLEEKTKEINHNVIQNSKNNELMSAFFSEQKELANKHQKEINEINEEIKLYQSQYEKMEMELKNYQNDLSKHRAILKNLNNTKEEYDSKLVQTNLKLAQEEEELLLAEEIKRCLKSYLSCSFDDALDSISEDATRILRAVPTMANATIRLTGQKEMGTGAIKDQINAIIDNDGELEIPIKSLSGGERSAVDLAIDLAVGNLIAEKANAGIDVLLLDEVMNGFDTNGKEYAIEMLKNFCNDRKILIVEHDPISKELISNRITVIREGETSYIK